jgi:hypothetical protein
VKVTVTLVPKIIPLLSGNNERAAVMTGGVKSIFSVTEAVAVAPLPSVAVPEIVWFAPSVATDWGLGQETGGTPPVQ